MKVRTHHIAASLFAGAVFLATAAWFGAQAPTALAACSTGTTVTVSFSGGTSLSGIQTVTATQTNTQGTIAPLPSGMTFMTTQLPAGSGPINGVIGQGVYTGGLSWALNWDTRNTPNGNFTMQAVAHYGSDTALDCLSQNPKAFSIANAVTQQATLTATVTPASWQAVSGQSRGFTANAVYTDQFGRPSPLPSGSTINWSTTAGSLSNPGAVSTILTAGTTAGTFPLTVTVGSSGLVAHAVSSIKVSLSAATTGSPAPSPTATPANATPRATPTPTPLPAGSTTSSLPPDPDLTTPLSTADTLRLANAPTVFRPTDPTNSKPVVAIRTLGCLERKLGENRFAAVSTGQAEPTSDERRNAAACFTGSDKIPAVFAPVQPSKDKIADLTTETGLVKINSLKNQTTSNSKGDKVDSILVSGNGTPNSNIFIYIFSDPMVLRAEADSQGKWTYVLQNPLVPGHHEIYAVAAKDSSTFVRSSAIPVSIAAAAGDSTAGSLVIEQTWQPAQIAFAGGAVLMVLAAIFLLLRLRHRRHPALAAAAPVSVPVMPAMVAPAVIMPTVATAAPTPTAPAAVDPVIPAAPAPAAPAATTPPVDETKT